MLFPSFAWADNFLSGATYSVCFTLHEDCTSKVVFAISQARKQILVQAYSFTSVPIAKALVDAKRRGINVKILLDKSQVGTRYSSTIFFEHNGINPGIDYRPAIAHNKVMIIDNEVVVTGSFNFTKSAATKNAENLLIIHDLALAKKYEENWYRREGQSISSGEYRLLKKKPL